MKISLCYFAAVCQGDQRNYYIYELLSFLEVLPKLAYRGRLYPKGAPFSGSRYLKGKVSQVEV